MCLEARDGGHPMDTRSRTALFLGCADGLCPALGLPTNSSRCGSRLLRLYADLHDAALAVNTGGTPSTHGQAAGMARLRARAAAADPSVGTDSTREGAPRAGAAPLAAALGLGGALAQAPGACVRAWLHSDAGKRWPLPFRDRRDGLRSR